MPQNTHLEIVSAENGRLPGPPKESAIDTQALRRSAEELAHRLTWIPASHSSDFFPQRCDALRSVLRPIFRRLEQPLSAHADMPDDLRWLHDNYRLLSASLSDICEGLHSLKKIPHVRAASGETLPRTSAIAEAFLAATQWLFTEAAFQAYVFAFQNAAVLELSELWALVPAMKLVLLEQIAIRAAQVMREESSPQSIGTLIRSLRDVGQTTWKEVLDPLIVFDQVLRQDPAGAYGRMDFESREVYREVVVDLARRSECSELEVAKKTLAMAQAAERRGYLDPRVAARHSHVGYYLVAEGRPDLQARVGYRASLSTWFSQFIRRHANEYYLLGFEALALALTALILLPRLTLYDSLGFVLFTMLVLVLPCSQCAVELMNYLTTSLLRAQILPKLDFSEGVCEDCTTIVAVPSLILNEAQVRRMVDDLEVRYLGNHDSNIHFALLTDLPDSPEPPQEDDPLVELCAKLIRDLNAQYAGDGNGTFMMFHRHRVYNSREGVWMGWERKRGKLLDLNKLLRNEYDSFPVKIGDLSILPRVRFVITLDADTELPRGVAQRMVGALAHPLNQAIIDPETNVVVAGYGILQPRVGVSVSSAGRSRLATIYSGQTGFDIYTRAVSDVYQDLFGEGIFTGKGIYEVDALHQVLNRRFPRNALLSHDLIEGAYARAGLASDVEVIDDYPSHYSAYNRRKHRWLRGDWQIAGWLFGRVPDESGRKVRNPISVISRWKIFDNLRRSLVEPVTFVLLLAGWLVLPGRARYWTIATVVLLFIPSWFHFVFSIVRALKEWKSTVAKDAVQALFTANVSVVLTLTFLAHQALLSLDAIVRTLVRRIFTRRRLLEWETAAEAELGTRKRTLVDIYLDYTPLVAFAVAGLILWRRPRAIYTALPILLLWAFSKAISVWLNRPPHPLRTEASEKDEFFLRRAALRTWRYFAEFSTEEHNWLIPDNVQEQPLAIAGRVSPTNIGFLLNARQVATEFGYLTVPEFAEQSARTLHTMNRMQRYRGHLLNWYDTRTLAPLPPAFISTVDNGNLVASLWTLQEGALDLLKRPVLSDAMAEGLLDHLRILADLRVYGRRECAHLQREIADESWFDSVFQYKEEHFKKIAESAESSKHAAEIRWFADQACTRLQSLKQAARWYAPWLLPEFSSLRDDTALSAVKSVWEVPSLENTPAAIDKLEARLQFALVRGEASKHVSLYQGLIAKLPEARAHAMKLIADLRSVAALAGKLADDMDFSFLLDERRVLLSIGFDVDRKELHSACYDLLASESRIASFVAIAKEDIPQESWFRLGRAHTLDRGRPVLLSWTGTMFEYLMPALWMRSYPNTLLERTRYAAVQSQQGYAAARRVPWGISESAYCKLDEAGNYQYHAFGIGQLALRKDEMKALVISPYSTMLSLTADPAEALSNLRRMTRSGWFAAYGFYESVDFTASHARSWRHRFELVRCWMAHHQGMSLLAIANFLKDGVVQRWFHNDPRVQASELLLHEKPVAHVKPVRHIA